MTKENAVHSGSVSNSTSFITQIRANAFFISSHLVAKCDAQVLSACVKRVRSCQEGRLYSSQFAHEVWRQTKDGCRPVVSNGIAA